MVFHRDYGQSRRGGHKTPPPLAQDAFERVWLVGLKSFPECILATIITLTLTLGLVLIFVSIRLLNTSCNSGIREFRKERVNGCRIHLTLSPECNKLSHESLVPFFNVLSALRKFQGRIQNIRRQLSDIRWLKG